MNYQIKELITKKEFQDVKALLKSQQLSFESMIDFTLGIYDGVHLIATGSLYKNVIKMIAVADAHQGENLTALILTHLVLKLSDRKFYKYFIFTKPDRVHFFIGFGFSLVSQTEQVALLENNIYPIEERLMDLKSEMDTSGVVATIVMNCNPITNGHLFLIETASKQNDEVIIFLVEEDQSVFPFKVRMELIKKATKHLKNVHILPSTPYIISSATFPTYFSKTLNQASKAHMLLDVLIFKEHFMRAFHISYRYVGTEPNDQTTASYNDTLKKVLKDQLIIVERKRHSNEVISASYIRKLAQMKQYDKIKALVPKPTYEFLKSKKGVSLFEQ